MGKKGGEPLGKSLVAIGSLKSLVPTPLRSNWTKGSGGLYGPLSNTLITLPLPPPTEFSGSVHGFKYTFWSLAFQYGALFTTNSFFCLLLLLLWESVIVL